MIGSLALKTPEADNRLANRQFLIDPAGEIRARYDKIHMFDVAITPQETYRESASYRPGDRAVVAQTAFAAVGMSICYDLRFAYLYRALAQVGAEVLVVPAAFPPLQGRRIGIVCFAPARLRPAVLCWLRLNAGSTAPIGAPHARPMAIALRSRLGGRCWAPEATR